MIRLVVALVVFAAAASLCVHRAAGTSGLPGQEAVSAYALQDFRDAIYYPVRDMLEGHDPYDAPRYMRRQPVGQPFPLYSPATLAIHLPFGLLPFPTARLAYLAYTVLLTPLVAALALRLAGVTAAPAAAFALAAMVLLGRPAQMNAFVGQSTMTVVLAAYATLALLERRPGLAGVALAVTTLKPTFGVPFAVFLLARRAWRTVGTGVAVGAALAAVPGALLVANAGGVRPFLASLTASEASFASQPSVDPATSIYRIDVAALIGRFAGGPLGAGDALVTVVVLATVAAVLWRLADESDPRSRADANALGCVATLAAVYHQAYCALLLLLPILVLAAGRSRIAGLPRWILVGLLLVPHLNYAASLTVVGHFTSGSPAWLAVTSANGLCVTAALALWLAIVRRPPPTPVPA